MLHPHLLLATIAAIAPALLPPSPLLHAPVWNATGHQLIALIAWSQMKPETREAAVELLREHPRFAQDFEARMPPAVKDDESLRPRWIFMHAATWPDLARNIPEPDHAKYNHDTWHYINSPIYLDAEDKSTIDKPNVNLSFTWTPETDQDSMNVIQALQMAKAGLQNEDEDLPDADRAVLLCWLEHLVGDLHQPLHSCALFSIVKFPKGDKGGNDIPVVGHQKLHKFWDETLGRTGSSVQALTTRASALTGDAKLKAAGQAAKKRLSSRTWMNESADLAVEHVYSEATLNAVEASEDGSKIDPVTLTASYVEAAEGVAKRRAVEAGFRLAALCERYFGQH